MNDTSFTVDIDDPADIRAKRETAEREVFRWQARVAKLTRVATDAEVVDAKIESAPTDESAVPTKAPGAMQELVVGVIMRDGEMQAKDVTRILREDGYDLESVNVSNALWYAAEKAGRIRRIGHGRYAPPSVAAVALDGTTITSSSRIGDGASLRPAITGRLGEL